MSKTKEKWIRWELTNNIGSKYYIESIVDNPSGLTIELVDSDYKSAKLRMIFENGIALRITNETFKLSTISYLNENYGGEFYAQWTFFKVENSEYLKYLSEQSGGISDYYGINHYVIITDEEIIDIASTYEPKTIIV